eukprot:g1917.t1
MENEENSVLKGLKDIARYGCESKDVGEQLLAIERFVHRVIDDLCGRNHDFVVLYGRVISETTTNIHDLVEGTKIFTIDSFGDDHSEETVATALSNSTKLPEKLCQVVARTIKGRTEEISRGLVRKATQGFSQAYLKDFDWSLRVALSSEKLSKLREPLLILSLYLTRLDGSRTEHVVELTKPKFQELLNTLGEINGAMQRTRF